MSRKHKIMLVEDEFIIALDLQKSLQALGYEVTAMASSGPEALAHAQAAAPDLALMDISLRGGMNGIQTAAILREQFNVPVIYVTAHSDPKTLENAKATEPLGYITKPFDNDSLRISIELAMFKHRQETALRQNERFLANTLQSIDAGVIVTDALGRITFINARGQEMSGWGQQEINGKPFREVFRFYDSSGLLECPVETVLRHKTAACQKDNGLHLMRKDGGKLYVENSVSPIFSAAGKLLGATLALQDNTERQQLETEKQRCLDELRRSNKALADFAFAASHDLREPLRKVIAFGDRLKNRLMTDDGEGQDYLERMQSSTLRMQHLIDSLLTYCQVSTHPKETGPVDLGQAAAEALADLETRITETGARVVVEPLPVIKGVKFQMYQLFQNLTGNALKYRKKDTPPVILIKSSKQDDGFWQITVEDNGIGFDEKYAQRIFQPFERLHGRGEFEGAGLGLATCEKIVAGHGGYITARSTPGKGATFIVTLPGNAV